MKKISLLILTVMVCFFMLSGRKTTLVYQANTIPKEVELWYTTHFYKFQDEVNTLADLANKSTSVNDYDALRTQIKKTRLIYKNIEFIFDYYQTPYNGTYINGAPLPKISEYFEADQVIAPCGLQALDEAVFEVESIENLNHIKDLVTGLKTRVDFITKTHLPIQLKSSQIIECIRSGMVRIFTLGVTGYDTPGSVNGIEESLQSMKSMEQAFMFFEHGMYAEAKPKFKQIKRLFKSGQKMLNGQTNFNDLNRLVFLKEVVNPLYSELLEFQNENNIKLEPYKKHAQDYQAKNIFNINFLKSNFFSELVYLPLDNPKTIALGELLFKDPQLSNKNIMSCLTCHNPEKAFTDGLPKSRSNRAGVFTSRNSPTILNAGYSTRYFLDMRAFDLEKQVMHVVDNDLEFNTDFKTIVRKLNSNSEYVNMFKAAYGDISKVYINERSVSNALAAYVNSLKSFNSAFDQYVRNESDEYPEDAKRGFNLFMGKAACGSCHFAPMFNGTIPPFYLDSESEVLGITQGFDSINPKLDTDLGRMNNGLSGDHQPYYKNSFKTVTIRNIALTAPYMHNGSFETLEEVLEFYNLGGGAGMGLEVENQTLPDTPLDLSKQDIKDIIAFMETLTDVSEYVN
ncbi:cytochrome-c peroxidase [Formosa algae]|uniref:Cytochrome c peroxidase n=1 Tax=Formosa algae TaxID=225843 RepID=A0A9X0YL65_9FLAO|nr:cytochrome c peroxidase [Formosa algae]MBP1840626.1 cytochrome c peroxidase [Formosa algae]MDQ0335961.1 cytochrome c peroxidase [Formosa algae]